MDNIIKILELLSSVSGKSYEHNSMKKISNKWKICVALSKSGWKLSNWRQGMTKYLGMPTDEVIATWSKDGENDIDINLSFTDQCLWLEYMERKSGENNE